MTRRGLPGIARAALAAAAIAAAALGGCRSASPVDPGGGARTLTYAALGASDAVGIGAFPTTEGYVYQLAGRMRGRGHAVTLRNFGINGALADEIVAAELEAAIAAGPDVVTVWTGSNDVVRGRDPEWFAGHLDRLLRELRARTRADVYVGDLADLTRAPLFAIDPDPDVTRARVDAFNVRIAALAAAHGAVLVRLSRLDLSPSTFSIDGFHPSNTGHRRIADLFWEQMEPRL